MQFLDALNKVIARYESLTPLFEAMSVMMDYDTYWKDLMKNPRIKNPKLVFQSEVEKGPADAVRRHRRIHRPQGPERHRPHAAPGIQLDEGL